MNTAHTAALAVVAVGPLMLGGWVAALAVRARPDRANRAWAAHSRDCLTCGPSPEPTAPAVPCRHEAAAVPTPQPAGPAVPAPVDVQEPVVAAATVAEPVGVEADGSELVGDLLLAIALQEQRPADRTPA